MNSQDISWERMRGAFRSSEIEFFIEGETKTIKLPDGTERTALIEKVDREHRSVTFHIMEKGKEGGDDQCGRIASSGPS